MTISASSRAHSREEGVEGEGPHKLHGSAGDLRSPSLFTPTCIQPPDISKDVSERGEEEVGGQSVKSPLLETSDVHLHPDPEVTQQPEEEEDDGVPHDRGWAWVVVFGMFVNFVLLSGYLKSSGLFFVELLRKFNAPATHTALLFSIRAGIFSLCGLYVMNVFLPWLGSRKLVMIGGVLMSLSAILSSVANELTLLICIHSFLLALGMAMLISPGEVLIGAYFKRRRSLALSLAKCGASIGNMAVPPLISYFLEEFGLTGTLLLYGGICLHSVAAGLLLRPTSFYSKRHQRRRQLQRSKQASEDSGVEPVKPSNANVVHSAGGGGGGSDASHSLPEVIVSQSNGGVSLVSNGVGSTVCVGSRPTPIISVETCGETSDARTYEVSSELTLKSGTKTVLPRKAKSEVKPSAVSAPPDTGSTPQACSDSRLCPHARGSRQPSPAQPGPMSAMTCSKHFDTLEGDLATLAYSTPDLGPTPSPSSPFRQRTYSEPPEKPHQIRARASHRPRQGSTILEAISQSSVIKYMSVSSLDVVSADLVAHSKGKGGLKAGQGSLDLGEERVSRTKDGQTRVSRTKDGERRVSGTKDGERRVSRTKDDERRVSRTKDDEERVSRTKDYSGSEGQKPACGCRRVLTLLLQCPKKLVFMLDFSLFKRPTFRLLMFYITVSPFVNITLDYLPALARENDVTESQASLLLSIIGGLDLLCRLACGFIADLKILRVPTMIIISFLILALVTQFVRFMTSFEHFVVLAVMQGIFGGVANCLAPVLIIEFVGLHNMGKGIGFCQLVSGASLCAVYPLLGLIRDTTGSYAIVYHTIGCGLLVAAGLLCLEGPIKKLEARKEANEQDDAYPSIDIVLNKPSNNR